MTGRRRGANPWLVLAVGVVIGLPVAWLIFTSVVGLVLSLAS